MAVTDMEQLLQNVMATVQIDIRTKRSAIAREQRVLERAQISLQRYQEELVQLEQKQSEIPILQATLLSRRKVYTELEGEPHLVWIDRYASTVSGPVMPVFPTPESLRAPFDDDEDEDE